MYECCQEVTETIRSSARLKNKESAKTMVETHRAKNPVSSYEVGEQVLLRSVMKDKRVKRGGKKITASALKVKFCLGR